MVYYKNNDALAMPQHQMRNSDDSYTLDAVILAARQNETR